MEKYLGPPYLGTAITKNIANQEDFFSVAWSFVTVLIIFHPSARLARSGIVVPFVRRRLRRRRRRTHSFGYYTNMVQQIEFIQTFNPSWHFFLPKVKVQGQRFKKKSC